METCNINCEICQDLIPLVRDQAASPSAEQAVFEHLTHCPECLALYQEETPQISENKDIRLKHKIQLILLIVPIVMALCGIGLLEGSGIFYNLVIMPLAGLCTCFLVGRTCIWLIPLWLGALYTLWQLLDVLLDQGTFLFSSYVYVGICILLAWIGAAIYALLCFALKKSA